MHLYQADDRDRLENGLLYQIGKALTHLTEWCCVCRCEIPFRLTAAAKIDVLIAQKPSINGTCQDN